MTLLEVQAILVTVFGVIVGILVTSFIVMCLVGFWKSIGNAFK